LLSFAIVGKPVYRLVTRFYVTLRTERALLVDVSVDFDAVGSVLFLGGGTEWVFQRFQVLTFIVSCRHNMRSNADVSKKFGKMTGHFVNTSSTFYNGSTINYPSRLYRYVIADVRRPKTFRISFADDTALSQFV